MIVGVGGVGINAVQGAHHAGAARVVAVDPVEFKREQALNSVRHKPLPRSRRRCRSCAA